MGAKIADYKALIHKLKTEAVNAGETQLECTAKELMEKLNEGNATLITCCSAMRQCMLVEDEVLVSPSGKKNVSTKMKIRYYLHDLDSRESAYVPKKRGRKTGSTLKRTSGMKRNPKTGKIEAKFNYSFMTLLNYCVNTSRLQNHLDYFCYIFCSFCRIFNYFRCVL